MAQQPQQGKPVDLVSLPANEVLMIRRSIEEVRLFTALLHLMHELTALCRIFNTWKIPCDSCRS